MSEVRVAAATRAFARGDILFGIIAFGIAGRDEVLLSSKTIHDFRALSKDHKILGALGRLMASLPEQALSFRACDQATLHAAFCAALQSDIKSLHADEALADPISLSALDAMMQFLIEGADSCSSASVHRAPLPLPKLPVAITSATAAPQSSDSIKGDSNADGKKMNMFQRGLSTLRTKHPKLSSHFQMKKGTDSVSVLTTEELAAQSEAAAAAVPDSDRLRGWEGFVSGILAATVFSSSNEAIYLSKINSALKDAIKDKKFITSAEFTDLKIRDRLVLQSTGVLQPLAPPPASHPPCSPAHSTADAHPASAASEVGPPACFGWFVKLPRHAISGQLHVTGKKVLSFSIKLAFSMELVGNLRTDIDLLPSPMLRVSFTSLPCIQVFLESTIKVGSLPLPIDKKLKKIIETKLREGIEKTMLLPHQLRIPLKPVRPDPSSVATQWLESDLIESNHVASSSEPALAAAACVQVPDSPTFAVQTVGSSDSDSDDE